MCEIAGVSRSGYYKWRGRDGVVPAKRSKVLKLVETCHKAHPSHGYRWVHAYLSQNEEGFDVSADYVRRAFRFLGISAQTAHKQKKSAPRQEKDPYPNLVFSTWETVDSPRQVVVSDMTAISLGWNRYYEIVFYFDAFTKQIIGCGLGNGRGGNEHYYTGLRQAVTNIERARDEAAKQLAAGCGEICVFHTDQGSVYTSVAYNEIIKEAGIVRSCSRAGKPTDNPVNESLNGWIKEELLIDFHLADAQGTGEVADILDDYIGFYNAERPCFALGYKTPNAFYDEFMAGKIERKDTFSKRVLDPTPKFVREKLAAAEEMAENNGGIGSSDMFAHEGCVYQSEASPSLVSTNEALNPYPVSTCA